MNLTGLGAYLATLRSEQGMSKAWLAARVKTTDTSLYRIEHGEQLPATPLLFAMVRTLRGSLEDVDLLLRDDGADAARGKELAERRLSLGPAGVPTDPTQPVIPVGCKVQDAFRALVASQRGSIPATQRLLHEMDGMALEEIGER